MKRLGNMNRYLWYKFLTHSMKKEDSMMSYPFLVFGGFEWIKPS